MISLLSALHNVDLKRATQAAPTQAPQALPAPAPNPQENGNEGADEDKGKPTKPVVQKNQINKNEDEASKQERSSTIFLRSMLCMTQATNLRKMTRSLI